MPALEPTVKAHIQIHKPWVYVQWTQVLPLVVDVAGATVANLLLVLEELVAGTPLGKIGGASDLHPEVEEEPRVLDRPREVPVRGQVVEAYNSPSLSSSSTK